jgi:hypothetical protein
VCFQSVNSGHADISITAIPCTNFACPHRGCVGCLVILFFVAKLVRVKRFRCLHELQGTCECLILKLGTLVHDVIQSYLGIVCGSTAYFYIAPPLSIRLTVSSTEISLLTVIVNNKNKSKTSKKTKEEKRDRRERLLEPTVAVFCWRPARRWSDRLASI